MIVIKKLAGFATVQDLGRVGYASHGVPRSGALCRSALRRANGLLGNALGAACVEVLGRLVVVAEADIDVATERGRVSLRRGEELAIEPLADVRVRYLAIAGGALAPVVLGSRSTLLGCFGQPLRVGDSVRAAGVPVGRPLDVAWPTDGPIAISSGPDDPSAFAALASRTWRIGTASDRVGTRLDAPKLVSESLTPSPLPSSPTAVGAIQLPSGGGPIVIGPDGPTTGGYPIIAVIARAHLDRFHAIALGRPVSFVRA